MTVDLDIEVSLGYLGSLHQLVNVHAETAPSQLNPSAHVMLRLNRLDGMESEAHRSRFRE